ncbi:methenyltetrahydrofolate synthase domain-containing protein [Biomphalaria glabrata]|uniref:Methenyltetrahydrofolate synthase domain-containing protein n=1 Tax=Biomphalaria glabrata TaxID=6526 RepID=A0A2C9JF05_BIOGL|nr:methenyltetrahydrofolate synthase domain-containing protein-like isoform X1 [Biomphalaria glabrata]XP_013067294.1 methenyltetrahydrofolate synthase domain-containing protein-like isoform X1 [Biomphalaria glabrata]XP_055870927.1 methenyltetrahydrofolate synthase domain-containing protein-like isoform X2 [Biomphalaria glabrata]KAI8737048.1 methenyltetrahydrofolate synthase domain-containing protein-like [Biomphalaria glabrata]KAI8777097.1 methenyltetrahydrofolate synthase domain-containing pro
MENNNAIAAQGPDDEAKIENVKPTVDESPDKDRSNRQRRRPYRREIHPEDETGKWAIRRKIWDYLEDNNLVNVPRPCHYRIPNFEGAAAANDKLATLEAFKKAKTVKVNPDKPQEQARFLVLEAGKELVLLNQTQRNLLVPTPQLKTGLLNRVVPPEGTTDKEKLRHCCTSQGVKENSKEVGLDEKIKIDLVVVGSVAVSRKGYRIGKGKGFADLEYAMMRTMGAIDANTVVVTSVHDSQVVDIPEELVDEHDMTVDFILTPTEIIETNCTRPKPTGVIWSHLEVNKFFQIPVLRQLREIEKQNGNNVFLKGQESAEDDPLENAEPPRPRRFRRFGGQGGYRGRGRPYRFRRGGGGPGRRREGGDDSNKENVETGDESGADGDDGRGRRRNYRNRRFRRGGKPRASESEHSDGGGEGGQGDGEDKNRQRRYPQRRRFQRRRRYDGPGGRRDNRGGGDHSGSDGEQKTSGDEDGEGRRPLRQKFRTNPDAIVWVGGLSRRLRVSELKTELRALNVNPLRLVWRGARGFAFLHFQTTDTAKEAVDVLGGKELDGREVKVEMANNDRPPRRRGGYNRGDKVDSQSSEPIESGDR